MKSPKFLRLRLRLIECSLVLVLGALTMGAVVTHQLLLDAANQPASDVSLSGSHWLGTLAAARLPGSVNFASIGAATPGAGAFSSLGASGDLSFGTRLLDPTGNILCDSGGNLQVAGNASFSSGEVTIDGSGDAAVAGTLLVGQLDTSLGQVIDGGGDVSAANLAASGFTSLDNNAITTDGYGALTANQVNVSEYLSMGAGCSITSEDGIFRLQGEIQDIYGNPITDGYGALMETGGLYLNDQMAAAGVITPTRTLIVHDASGGAFLIPCAPAP